MKRLLILPALLACYVASAQLSTGFSAGYLADSDWNRPLSDLWFNNTITRVASVMPFAVGVHSNYRIGNLSIDAGLKLIDRRLDVTVRRAFAYNTFRMNHQTLEVPIELGWHLPINASSNFMVVAGIGVDRVISSTQSTTQHIDFSYTVNEAEFVSDIEYLKVVNPDKIILSGNYGVGLENSLGNLGTLLIQVKYHFQFSESIWYDHRRNGLDSNSAQYRVNYGMLSLTWLLPRFKKPEMPENVN